MQRIAIKRIYDGVSEDDGVRILVDRLWPRGISKADAAIDIWAKDIAPSTELRKWFHSDPTQWGDFQTRYRKELATHGEALRGIAEACGGRPATLLYSAKDRDRNHALVLREVLASL